MSGLSGAARYVYPERAHTLTVVPVIDTRKRRRTEPAHSKEAAWCGIRGEKHLSYGHERLFRVLFTARPHWQTRAWLCIYVVTIYLVLAPIVPMIWINACSVVFVGVLVISPADKKSRRGQPKSAKESRRGQPKSAKESRRGLPKSATSHRQRCSTKYTGWGAVWATLAVWLTTKLLVVRYVYNLFARTCRLNRIKYNW